MEDSPIINGMRERAAQCRRLAKALTERRSAEILVKMAEEIEADLGRIESRDMPNPVPPEPLT